MKKQHNLKKIKFDEASSYHSKQFKLHVAVKKMINPGNEMDIIITAKLRFLLWV